MWHRQRVGVAINWQTLPLGGGGGPEKGRGAFLVEWGVVIRTTYKDKLRYRYLVKPFSGGVLIAAVYGNGAGERAMHAVQRAVGVLSRHAHERVELLVIRCHHELMGSQGVGLSLASFNTMRRTITWLGVGTGHGLLLRAKGKVWQRSLISQHGVVGRQLPALRATVTTITPGDVLVLTSDALHYDLIGLTGYAKPPQIIAEQVLAEQENRNALVLVARYAGERGRATGTVRGRAATLSESVRYDA